MVKLIVFLSIFFVSNILFAQDDSVFLLTKSLTFSKSKNLSSSFTIKPGNQPTLFKVVSSKNGINEVQVIQENGKTVNKTFYVSSSWFAKGTSQSAVPFQVDPNKIVSSASLAACEMPTEVDPTNPCSVIDSGQSDPEMYITCFDSIKRKLNIKTSESAYTNISKLYSLPPAEQKFMAMVLTMYGEARGTRPPEENMAMVMKVIENRTRMAQEQCTGANELDVVLQSAQFSMFNPGDPNWKAALGASGTDLKDVMKVFALRNSIYRCENVRDNVCHYHVPGIDRQAWMETKKKISVTINGQTIRDHQFYAGVAWAFNPNNPYKRYAMRKGYVK